MIIQYKQRLDNVYISCQWFTYSFSSGMKDKKVEKKAESNPNPMDGPKRNKSAREYNCGGR